MEKSFTLEKILERIENLEIELAKTYRAGVSILPERIKEIAENLNEIHEDLYNEIDYLENLHKEMHGSLCDIKRKLNLADLNNWAKTRKEIDSCFDQAEINYESFMERLGDI